MAAAPIVYSEGVRSALAPGIDRGPGQKRPTVAGGNSGKRKRDQSDTSEAAPLPSPHAIEQPRSKLRARVATNEEFCKDILAWDLLAELQAEVTGKRAQYEQEHEVELEDIVVPNRFQSRADYTNVWVPLVVREIRAQTLNQLTTEGTPADPCAVTIGDGVTSGDPSGLTNIQPMVQTDRGMHKSPIFNANELVLFLEHRKAVSQIIKSRKEPDKAGELQTPKSFLGMVTVGSRAREGLTVRVQKGMLLRNGPKTSTAAVYMISLGSLVPALREYDILNDLHRIELAQEVLTGRSPPGKGQPFDMSSLGSHFVQWMQQKFNTSQQAAIEAAATQEGFTLIQGPPGTGKTTVVKALLNALHVQALNRHYEKVVQIAITGSLTEKRKEWERIQHSRPHILVTAPSNVAVDNILLRIIEEGFKDGTGQRYNPTIVRVTSAHMSMSPALDKLKPVLLGGTIEDLISTSQKDLQERLCKSRQAQAHAQHDVLYSQARLTAVNQAAEVNKIPEGWEVRVDANGLIYFVNHLEKCTQTTPPPPPQEGQRCLKAKDMPEYQIYAAQLVSAVEHYDRIGREQKLLNTVLTAKGQQIPSWKLRENLEPLLLDDAHLVFSTLNLTGSESLGSAGKFSTVVVDEAAQAVELSTLIPLRLGSRHCVLVGDPNQLPATVFSQGGNLTQYDRSLFQRLQACGHNVCMLNTQYRMHPFISEFPRSTFYDSKLLDGDNVNGESYRKPYHSYMAFRPFVFYDLDYGQQEKNSTSWRNPHEAAFARKLYTTLRSVCGSEQLSNRVGIITPYSQQLGELKREFQAAGCLGEVQINTVDGFQGKEKDIIIVSCVRAQGSHGIGFLADVRRMNVALTRAKYGLYIIGRGETLRHNPQWAALIRRAADAHALLKIDTPETDLLAYGHHVTTDPSVASHAQVPASQVPAHPDHLSDAEEGEVTS